jgi:toxin ParE1/3/4
MVRINWTKSAVEDLKNIADYISAIQSVKESKSIIKSIRIKVGNLKVSPQTGIVIDGITDGAIRRIDEKHYKIIYKIISSEQIDILTIHESRSVNRNVF